ncbi:MAG: hypothetical protein ACYC4N_26755 [Pirellulaceae bacterium]
MNTKLLLKSLAIVAVSILVAGVGLVSVPSVLRDAVLVTTSSSSFGADVLQLLANCFHKRDNAVR